MRLLAAGFFTAALLWEAGVTGAAGLLATEAGACLFATLADLAGGTGAAGLFATAVGVCLLTSEAGFVVAGFAVAVFSTAGVAAAGLADSGTALLAVLAALAGLPADAATGLLAGCSFGKEAAVVDVELADLLAVLPCFAPLESTAFMACVSVDVVIADLATGAAASRLTAGAAAVGFAFSVAVDGTVVAGALAEGWAAGWVATLRAG